MEFALQVADELHTKLSGKDLVVTSLLDGHHNPGSLHPKGRAADLRTNDLTLEQALEFYRQLRELLHPKGYDVVIEGAHATTATTGAHIHLEWDPKV